MYLLKDPHNLNVDVLALLLKSKCFHVLVMVNPFFPPQLNMLSSSQEKHNKD